MWIECGDLGGFYYDIVTIEAWIGTGGNQGKKSQGLRNWRAADWASAGVMTLGGVGRQILRGVFGVFGDGGVGDGARLVRGRRGSLRQGGGLMPSM